MKTRLNKLISDYGICSRREADLFIEMGRVTVNGKHPEVGTTVTETDIILVDDTQISLKDIHKGDAVHVSGTKAANLIFGDRTHTVALKKKNHNSRSSHPPEEAKEPTGGPRRERYGKYNKFTAARKAAKQKEEELPAEKKKAAPKVIPSASGKTVHDVIGDAANPKFKRSMKKGSVAQRIASAPKSASLRKTSKNNPINKANRATRNNSKGK